MVYNTGNYWVLGLGLSSGILNKRERERENISETGSVPFLR
jgi:hypothetical protein